MYYQTIIEAPACVARRLSITYCRGATPMRSILLLLLGVPLPIVILIALFTH